MSPVKKKVTIFLQWFFKLYETFKVIWYILIAVPFRKIIPKKTIFIRWFCIMKIKVLWYNDLWSFIGRKSLFVWCFTAFHQCFIVFNSLNDHFNKTNIFISYLVARLRENISDYSTILMFYDLKRPETIPQKALYCNWKINDKRWKWNELIMMPISILKNILLVRKWVTILFLC